MKLSDPTFSPDAPGDSSPSPRRTASVTLGQQGEGSDDQSPLDPANQSMADALRIVLRLLQFGMVVLAALYIFSGFKFVNEGQQGIRLLFGARQGPALDPGMQVNAPFPLGELVLIDRGLQDLSIDKDFWVYMQEGTPDTVGIDKLPPSESLKPDQGGSGSVLTADGNIAHTRWKVGYRRDDAAKYAQNVLDQTEWALVRAAVKRGVVQACAHVTVDELLKQSADQTASVASRAKAVAQRTLDDAESGIIIDQLTLVQAVPPLWVRNDFSRVQSTVANAAKAVESARSEANNALNMAAGEAAPYLVSLIEQYEDAAAKNDEASMAATMATIDAMMQGEEVEVEGKKVKGLIGGEVSAKLADAGRYRSAVVTKAKGDLDRYEAKLAQFKANPGLMVHKEWSDAVASFINRPTVQVMLAPRDIGTMRMLISPDPNILRDMDRAIKMKESAESEAERMRMLRENKFKTDMTTIKAAG